MSKLVRGYNDLMTKYPSLAAEWDYEKNYPITPDHVSYGDNHKYYWLCPKGHPSYLMSPNSRTNDGSGCQVCANRKLLIGFNDLASSYPELAAEWDYTKNEKGPEQFLFNSSEKVYWICPKGHDAYPRKINERRRGKACPRCARQHAVDIKRALAISQNGSVKSLFPELAAEWDYTKNEKGPESYPPGSSESVYWVCSWCRTSWPAIISSRTKSKSGCPHCRFRSKTSFPEQALFFYLSQHYPDAQNSFSESLHNMELDIFIPSLKSGIEYDGIHWHDATRKEKDLEKYALCKQRGIYLIRVRESDEDASSICDEYIVRSDYSSYSSLDKAIVEVFEKLGCLHVLDINSERDCNIIRSRYFASLKENSLLRKYPEIAKEWHPTKNDEITPDMVSPGVNTKYWWICPICKHEYKKSVSDRVNGSACKKCSSQKKSVMARERHLQRGKNDLQTLRPDLVEEWDHSETPGLTPKDCTLGSHEPIIWRCKICGELWKASVCDRTNGSGCPTCGRIKAGESQKRGSINKYGSLAEAYPEIALQWDYSNNIGITPNDVSPIDKSPGLHWICSRCGEPFVSSVINLTTSKHIGCRKCRYKQTGEERKANPETSPFYGKHHSAEAKEKISKANSGMNNSQYGKTGADSPNYGVKFSEEHRQKISQALKGKKKSEETRLKLSAAKKGKPNTSKTKRVRQLSMDGVEIQVFESIREAERAMGITSQRSHIGDVCRGNSKSAYGYKWEYVHTQ